MPDRIIRESICMSESLSKLTDFEERFWHRLIVCCDDFGRFDARPAVLKGRLFPLLESKTKKDMTAALEHLASVGLVELYKVEGKPFLRVVTWGRYQRVRAKRSKFPGPDGTCCQLTSDAAEDEYEYESEKRKAGSGSECGGEKRPAGAKPANANAARAPRQGVSAAGEAFLERINPRASDKCLGELAELEREMGIACCLRAMDSALDAGKATWPYIRAILRQKRDQGVRSIEEWDAVEAGRERRKKDGATGKKASSAKSWTELAEDLEQEEVQP